MGSGRRKLIAAAKPSVRTLMDCSPTTVRWAKVIDQTLCIGCHACTTACKSENVVPVGVSRTYVKSVDVGIFPEARRFFQVTRCNQCADAPCINACPTSAMFKRTDGIVDFNKAICIGCKACMAACPYDAIFINPDDHSAEKCNFCAHRVDSGLEPACVVICPVEAIVVGDLNDPNSRVARIINRQPVSVRKPEKETSPTLFYKGAHNATLDPLAARQPSGGLFMSTEQRGPVVSGVASTNDSADALSHELAGSSSAAALLSYDVAHALPWGWRVSVYTWTKGLSAGIYLLILALVLTGALPTSSPLWLYVAPIGAGTFLLVTGMLLIWDLKHPLRFYMIFIRPQWRSWLVRGAMIIAAFSAVLAVHVLASLLGLSYAYPILALAGAPLAVLTAVYTGYLFAQARARDLWQSPLLPPHLLVQAIMVAAAALIPAAVVIDRAVVRDLSAVLAITAAIHLLFVLGETTLPHVTAHARLAMRNMVAGRYAVFFWAGAILAASALAAPFLAELGPQAPILVCPFALLGMLAYEHAYVQAGQSVPLA